MSAVLTSEFMAAGTMTRRRGYILQAAALLDADAATLERRFGMGAGRLAEGWYWLVLIEAPKTTGEFQVMGSTLYPDGALPEGGAGFDDLARLKVSGYADIKQGMLDFWPLRGAYRFMKAVPCIPHSSDSTYPPAADGPVLQIKLLEDRPFRVIRRVGPHECLRAGSADWQAALLACA
jgi:hypothetical protein